MGETAAPSKARTAGVGAFVATWAFLDGAIIGGPIVLAAALWRPLITFVIGAVVWALVNQWACGWINRQWDTWIGGSKVEARLHKLRDGKKARRAVDRITRGSPFWFVLAAVLTSACQVIIRIATGKPTNKGQQLWASIAPGIIWGGTFALIGLLAQKAAPTV